MGITRPTITDDDGSGTTGSVLNAAFFADLLDRIDAFISEWTTYTPTWVSSGTQPTIGNGSITGRYQKVGKTVFFEMELTFGTTTTPGTGTYQFGLPLLAAAIRGRGKAVILGASTTRYWGGFWIMTATNALAAYYDNETNHLQCGQGAPATWGAGDYIKVSGFYVAA